MLANSTTNAVMMAMLLWPVGFIRIIIPFSPLIVVRNLAGISVFLQPITSGQQKALRQSPLSLHSVRSRCHPAEVPPAMQDLQRFPGGADTNRDRRRW